MGAFKVFDPENKGTIHKDFITQVLKTNADRFNDDEIAQMFSLCAPNEDGQFDYKALCYTLTHGALANDAKGKGGERQFNGLIDVYTKTLKSDGIQGLYRGFAISCVGIFIYRGMYFGLFDTLKPILLGEDAGL